jgi:hypothetical protein
LLAWDKDNYTERFLAFLLGTCVLQTKLVHLHQTSLLFPCHISIVASDSLRLLYLFLYSEYIKHFQVLGFLPFTYSSCMHFPLIVWPIFNNITAFVLSL